MTASLLSDFDVSLLIPMGIALTFAGAFAGVIAGMLGVGGGIVIVPVLYFIFESLSVGGDKDSLMHIAVGTSLATIIPTSISSALSHYKRGSIDIALLKRWAIWIIFGVLIGAVVASFLNKMLLTAIFAMITLFAAYSLYWGLKGKVLADNFESVFTRNISGLCIGAGSAMAGIGGGAFVVPLLSAYGYAIKRAIGTASGVGFLIAIPGTLGFIFTGLSVEGLPALSIGYINLLAFIVIMPMTIFLAPLGARLAYNIQPERLRLIFCIFLIFTACRMLLELVL